MSEVNEMSAGSRGSRGYKCRQSFERWAEKDGRLRTIRRTNGDYLDASARWAWEGWQAAALTDDERLAIETIRRNDRFSTESAFPASENAGIAENQSESATFPSGKEQAKTVPN